MTETNDLSQAMELMTKTSSTSRRRRPQRATKQEAPVYKSCVVSMESLSDALDANLSVTDNPPLESKTPEAFGMIGVCSDGTFLRLWSDNSEFSVSRSIDLEEIGNTDAFVFSIDAPSLNSSLGKIGGEYVRVYFSPEQNLLVLEPLDANGQKGDALKAIEVSNIAVPEPPSMATVGRLYTAKASIWDTVQTLQEALMEGDTDTIQSTDISIAVDRLAISFNRCDDPGAPELATMPHGVSMENAPDTLLGPKATVNSVWLVNGLYSLSENGSTEDADITIGMSDYSAIFMSGNARIAISRPVSEDVAAEPVEAAEVVTVQAGEEVAFVSDDAQAEVIEPEGSPSIADGISDLLLTTVHREYGTYLDKVQGANIEDISELCENATIAIGVQLFSYGLPLLSAVPGDAEANSDAISKAFMVLMADSQFGNDAITKGVLAAAVQQVIDAGGYVQPEPEEEEEKKVYRTDQDLEEVPEPTPAPVDRDPLGITKDDVPPVPAPTPEPVPAVAKEKESKVTGESPKQLLLAAILEVQAGYVDTVAKTTFTSPGFYFNMGKKVTDKVTAAVAAHGSTLLPEDERQNFIDIISESIMENITFDVPKILSSLNPDPKIERKVFKSKIKEKSEEIQYVLEWVAGIHQDELDPAELQKAIGYAQEILDHAFPVVKTANKKKAAETLSPSEQAASNARTAEKYDRIFAKREGKSFAEMASESTAMGQPISSKTLEQADIVRAGLLSNPQIENFFNNGFLSWGELIARVKTPEDDAVVELLGIAGERIPDSTIPDNW